MKAPCLPSPGQPGQATQILTIAGPPAATRGLAAPRTAFLFPFFPASSRKSAQPGGGPGNKHPAAMETRPAARGQIPASCALWMPGCSGGGRLDFQRWELPEGFASTWSCTRKLIFCSQRTRAAVPSWEPSVDTKKGSPREGIAGSPRPAFRGISL